MPYLGRPVTNAGQFEIIDDISSSFNGSNTSFTLQVGGTNILPDVANVIISLDGVTQIPDSAYSITGSTINFTEAPLSSTSFSGILAGQSQFIESGYITNTHISDSANISGSKINTDFSSKTVTANSGSFNYITASVIDTDASTIRVGGTPINKTLVDNLTTMTGSGTVQGTGQSDSPTFAGGTISGDFTVGGTLTAQEIHTEFTSASIVFTSGSTIFGNSSDDVHSMTGSLNVSGSITMADGDLSVTDDVVFGATATVETGLNLESGTFTVKNATGDSNGLKISQGGSDASNILNHYNGTLNLGVNNSVDMTLKGGNVGIGTTDPSNYNSNADNLVIHETGDFTGITLSADNDQGSNIYFADPQDDNVGGITYNHTSNYMNFRINGSEKIRIDSSGNVGIGTTSPVSLLYLEEDNTTNVTDAASMISNSSLTINGNSSDGSDVIRMGAMSNATGDYFIEVSNSAGNAAYSLLLNPINGGKVGIGTTSPNGVLDITKDQSRTTKTGTSTGLLHLDGGTDDGSGNNGDITAITFTGRHTAGTVSAIIANELDTDGSHLLFGTSNVYANGVTNTAMEILPSGTLLTTSGSAVSTFTNQQKYYVSSPDATHLIANSPEEYSVTDSDANYKRMKTFIAGKSGKIRVKWEGYIQAGSYWWSWRFSKNNGTSTNIQYPTLMKHPNGDDAQARYADGLASGVSNSVHAYREFDVALDGVEPGDQIELWMRSSNNSGGQVTGNGQTLYAKNFEVYSDVPTLEENGAVSKNLTIQAGSGNDGILYIGDDDGDRGEIIYRNDCDFELRNTCSTGALQFYTEGSRNIDFFTGGTQRWSVLAGGSFEPFANNTYNIGSDSKRVSVLYTSNSVNVSDRTLKENIVDCNLGLTFINTLQPKSYRMKDIPADHDDYNRTHFGLLAQDLIDTELSGSVFGERDGEYSLAYNDVIAPMIKAIQELSDENDSLKSRIEALES